MRKLLALLYTATFLACYPPPFASACGDKILMLGRGVKNAREEARDLRSGFDKRDGPPPS